MAEIDYCSSCYWCVRIKPDLDIEQCELNDKLVRRNEIACEDYQEDVALLYDNS